MASSEPQALASSSSHLQPANQFSLRHDGCRVSTLPGRTVDLLIPRRAVLPVVIPAGQDHKKLTIQPVNQAMFLTDAARPAAGQVLSQGLGFADASEGIAQPSQALYTTSWEPTSIGMSFWSSINSSSVMR
jgi:hypothetical protein